ncbi:MAG: hypothetical protein IK115_02385 [Lachnospiraceae bacterium]|nr:hypothetical protein [Lachnospiraceae bacterium]
MKIVVLIPAYKPQFDSDEEACVQRYMKVLAQRDIVFVLPEGLDSRWYTKHFPKAGQRCFPAQYFKNIRGYNRLLLSESFYDAFSEYEYMLLAQPDAVIWEDEDKLDAFAEEGYDYYGAPWEPPRRIWEWTVAPKEGFPGFRIRCCKGKNDGIVMGNGGFSLRHIRHCRELIREFAWRKSYWFWKRNEDIFFGVFGRDSKRGFKPADPECGRRFAAEYHLKERVAAGDIPYAVHGWSKDFADYKDMQDYLHHYGVEI